MNARVSSPASTGGAGTTFEQHVGAYWLAQLLVGAIPPILIDATVAEVCFQTARLGWHTDDFLVVCTTGGAVRNLVGQVKRALTVSASDESCSQVVVNFWNDFKGPRFSKECDRLTLVVLRGTNTLLEHFAGLLDCARAARDGAEFEQRLNTAGFISATAVRYSGELQQIVGAIERKSFSAADIWPFLRVLHVLSLDLHSSTRQTEAHIKSMLALAANDGDPLASAAVSWNELVGEASVAMATGSSLRRDDLPAAIRERHSVINAGERRVLRALSDHTAPVLRAIRSTLGPDLHLARAALVQKVLDALENAQVVLVAGPAGSGKSAVGKDAVGVLALNHFVFGFRVEEFAQPHVDATLAAAQVPANWEKLRAILGAQTRKVVLVESVERLLEKTTRDAFTDLLTLAADDDALRIVLTCRDYSVEQVRASFLQPHRIKHMAIQVPPLQDDELSEVQEAYPVLATPLTHPALRDILRNPFVLDKALGIPWSSEQSLPQNEREFRALFWREIVRGGQRVAPALGRQREGALEIIAVRRARALSAHIPVSDLDAVVVESLRGDSLIVSPDDNPLVVATAHDVLEDWAILQWLDEKHLSQAAFKTLSDAIGMHPAVRRSYRKWVAELVERDSAAADRLFRAGLSESEISAQFRDDTLVSLLKAPSSPDFLARHEGQLLANDRVLLKRVVQLLRVACMKSREWLTGLIEGGSIVNVPDGSAWPAVLRIVHRNLAAFTDNERALLLGLEEDAVRGVSWWAPDLEGAEDVAGIAHWLLDALRDYGGQEPRERVLSVIAKIPYADGARFEAELRGHPEARGRVDMVARDFQDLIYGGTDGMPAARDLPDVIVSIGREYLLASKEDIDDVRRYAGMSPDVDLYFGIKEERHDSFPPSGIRGPWLPLLRFHSEKALQFYIQVFSHSADWYAHPRLHDRLEMAWEVELAFADGATQMQWTNARLWGLYRGMTVGPYVLQSMLMALETWLLEIGKQQPARLDGILIGILRHSDNAALTAVVSSVAIAYPHAAGETLLVLLSVRDYIDLDRNRMARERHTSALSYLPTLQTDHLAYDIERKQANDLPHRQHDLEVAIVSLQLGSFAPRVQALLDEHLAALPPKEEQDEHDRVWRLALHRMDLRQYTLLDTPVLPQGDFKPVAQPRRYVSLDPKPPERDLQAIIDERAEQSANMNARLGVLMWGIKAFDREAGEYDPASWSSKLAAAQTMDREGGEEDGSRDAPGFVAAVCIRDRWDEMTTPQRDWCVDTACAEIMYDADGTARMTRIQSDLFAANRACANVLAALLHKVLDPIRTEQVRTAFVVALTHPVEQVQLSATHSIDDTVWSSDRGLALRCVNALAAEANIVVKAQEAEQEHPYDERRNRDEIMAEATAEIRARFWKGTGIANDAHVTLNIYDGFGAYALNRMLMILGRVPLDPLAIEAFARASNTLASWWTADDTRHSQGNRNFRIEGNVSRRVQEFLLRTSPEAARKVLAPLLTTVERHSHELQSLLQGLTAIQDTNPNTAQYWFVWETIADAVKRSSWVSRLRTDRNPHETELLSAVFLNLDWKDNVRHWRFLDGYAHLVHALFSCLSPSSAVLDVYARFLYHIGDRSLPDALIHVADALRLGSTAEMLAKPNTVFLLEVLLQRYVYGRPLELKRNERLRDSVLFILDCLVESGSSAAFRMRDDFVTPMSA
ncbi:MAG TPA: hypothetical protein VFW04_00635 [Gemmatimonadaceae bacterium]|nr:hypothetical protein [Gemmatimonadaceae bacterium]